MKRFSSRYFNILLIGSLLWLIPACKKEQGQAITQDDTNYVPRGDLSDLAYNPIKKDGTIDSTFIPIIKWDEVVYDFGTIRHGEIVEKKYTFKNIGTAPLIILNGTSTCGCTIPEWPKNHILPDSTGFVLVRFNSKNKEGPQNKEVTIFANTIPNRNVLNIKGVVERNK